MDGTTRKLVDFAGRLRFGDLTDAALAAAKARILSTLGASLAAFEVEPVRIVRRLAQPPAAGPAATIFGSLARTTPDMAAFVNSAMVRALDMSDSYVMSAVSHPADAFPSILAVSEAEKRGGEALLIAMAISYEAQCRFVDIVPYNQRGWDQTPVVALGAALGCSRLMDLSEQQTGHAIALAVVPNIALNQTRTGALSMWKGMAGPQGARAGVFAAYLAREGMTGPDDVFEGRYGMWNQMMNGERFELQIPSRFEGHLFAIQQTMIKSFPVRFNCQVPVFAAQKLRRLLDVQNIESLKIESIRQAFARWMDTPEIWKPETRESADHSLPCTVAMALLDGTITPEMMERGRFRDDDVQALMRKCTLELPDEFAALAPQTRCCRLTARLKDGQVVIAEYRRSLDDDTADSGWTHGVAKFQALTRERLSTGTQGKIIATVERLENEKSVERLIAMTALSS